MKKLSFSVKLQILMGFVILFTIFEFATQHFLLNIHISSDTNNVDVASNNVGTPAESLTSQNEFDCAIHWLRLPKTASTSVMAVFIGPLFSAGKFTTTDLDPNTCVAGDGGCTHFWNTLAMKKGEALPRPKRSRFARRPTPPPPPYGIPLESGAVGNGVGNFTHIPMKQRSGRPFEGRCFPMRGGGPRVHCLEYEAQTRTMNFGRGRRNPFLEKRRHLLKKYKNNPEMTQKILKQKVPKVPPIHQGEFNFGPALKTHVGLDVSLFGWLLPAKTMVFSAFREPKERLLSSFHYGIEFGGGRPGEVKKCQLPGVSNLKKWQERVVKARERMTLQKNSTDYQTALREYLTSCACAADNAYVQFLDPNTKDVSVALENLERYVIVGLQTDVTNSLKRWTNITLKSCRHHPRINEIRRTLLNGIEKNDGKKFRKSVAELQQLDEEEDSADKEVEPEEEPEVEVISAASPLNGTSSTISFDEPNIESFDEDLQELIRNYTSGDEVIFQRVLELYEEQMYWGL